MPKIPLAAGRGFPLNGSRDGIARPPEPAPEAVESVPHRVRRRVIEERVVVAESEIVPMRRRASRPHRVEAAAGPEAGPVPARTAG